MIEIPRKDTHPQEIGDYVAVIAGTPLPIVARWTGEQWQRGATKIHRMDGWVGPIELEWKR